MTHGPDLDDIIDLFRQETRELVQEIGEIVLKLERSEEAHRSGHATEAFRLAHGIKGSAATLGFGRIQKVVHGLEDLLAALRDGGLSPDPDLVDLLFEALDTIDGLTTSSQPGEENLGQEEKVLQRLRSRLTTEAAPLPASPAAEETRHGESPREPDAALWSDGGEEHLTFTTDLIEDEELSPSLHEEARLLEHPLDEPSEERLPRLSDDLSADEAPPPPKPDAPLEERGLVRIPQKQLDKLFSSLGELAEIGLKVDDHLGHLGDIEDHLSTLAQGPVEKVYHRLTTLNRAVGQDFSTLSKLILDIRGALTSLRLVPMNNIFPFLRRAVRDVSRKRHLKVDLTFSGGDIQIDRAIAEELKSPLIHLLRNAVDHGIEPSTERLSIGKDEEGHISVQVEAKGSSVVVLIDDDGRGIDFSRVRSIAMDRGWIEPNTSVSQKELAHFLFRPGFSTVREADGISGRGVGLDAVKRVVEQLKGTIAVESIQGYGTSFQLTLPLSLATEQGLFVQVGQRQLVFPRTAVQRVIPLQRSDVVFSPSGVYLWHRDRSLPVVRLEPTLTLRPLNRRDVEQEALAVILAAAEAAAVIVVDDLLEEGEMVFRAMGPLIKRVKFLSGLTHLPGGQLGFVLNPVDLVREALKPMDGGSAPPEEERKVVLIVDDSVTTRALNQRFLLAAGFQVLTAPNGTQALEVLRTEPVHLVLTDVQMPLMDGYELTRSIRDDPALGALPVVLLSALGERADVERGLDAGADAYLVKSRLSQRELVDTLRQLL